MATSCTKASGSIDNNDVGTEDFKAPEIIEEGEQTEKVDIWAVGVLAFYLFSGG